MIGVSANFFSLLSYRQKNPDISKEASVESPQGEIYLRIFFGLKIVQRGIYLFLSCLAFTPKRDIPYAIMLLETDEFTCSRVQDTQNKHTSSNAIFKRNVCSSSVFVFANNCLTTVALWRKKCSVKVPVLRASTYRFKPGKHSPGRKKSGLLNFY